MADFIKDKPAARDANSAIPEIKERIEFPCTESSVLSDQGELASNSKISADLLSQPPRKPATVQRKENIQTSFRGRPTSIPPAAATRIGITTSPSKPRLFPTVSSFDLTKLETAKAAPPPQTRSSPFTSNLRKRRGKLSKESLEQLQEQLATNKSPPEILGRFDKITSSSTLEIAGVEDSGPAKSIHSGKSSTSEDDAEVKALRHPRDDVYLDEIAAYLADKDVLEGIPEMDVLPAESQSTKLSPLIPPDAPTVINLSNRWIAVKIDSAATTPGVESESQQFVFSKDAGNPEQAPDYADNTEYSAFFSDKEKPSEQEVEKFLDYILPKHKAAFIQEAVEAARKEREEADKPMRRNGSMGDMTHPVFKAYYELERRKAENTAITGQQDKDQLFYTLEEDEDGGFFLTRGDQHADKDTSLCSNNSEVEDAKDISEDQCGGQKNHHSGGATGSLENTNLDQAPSKEFISSGSSNKDEHIDRCPRANSSNYSGGQANDNEHSGQADDGENSNCGGRADSGEDSDEDEDSDYEDHSDQYSDTDSDTGGMLHFIPLNRLNAKAFTCIFSTAIPNPPFKPTLRPSGRPMIPHSADLRLFTIVATYHPPTNEFFLEVTKFVGIPKRFTDTHLVDLLSMQEAGYIQAYHCRETKKCLEWSLCTISCDGVDFLYASDTNVMIHRIVTAMVNSVEKSLGLRGSRMQLEGIPEGCFKETFVEVWSKMPGMPREVLKATVALDYETVEMDWDWLVIGSRRVKRSHSEGTMWMGASLEE
ncbi:hypothetical protein RUND412_006172 [Rhizina undulata]